MLRRVRRGLVGNQHATEREARAPAGRRVRLGCDVLLEEQGLAAAVDVAEVLDAVAVRVLLPTADLDAEQLDLRREQRVDLRARRGHARLRRVADQHDGVNRVAVGLFPRGHRRVAQDRDGLIRAHRAAKRPRARLRAAGHARGRDAELRVARARDPDADIARAGRLRRRLEALDLEQVLLRGLHPARHRAEKRATLGGVGELHEQHLHVLAHVPLEDVRLQLAEHRARVA